jgi:hypothetical protein
MTATTLSSHQSAYSLNILRKRTFDTEDGWSRMTSVVLWEVAMSDVSPTRQGYHRSSGCAQRWTHRKARTWRMSSRDASVSSRRSNEWGAVGWFITVTGRFLASADAMKWRRSCRRRKNRSQWSRSQVSKGPRQAQMRRQRRGVCGLRLRCIFRPLNRGGIFILRYRSHLDLQRKCFRRLLASIFTSRSEP